MTDLFTSLSQFLGNFRLSGSCMGSQNCQLYFVTDPGMINCIPQTRLKPDKPLCVIQLKVFDFA